MPRFDIEIKAFGNRAILIEWPNKIDEEILDDIIRFTPLAVASEKDELINYTPGYNSLLLEYNKVLDDFENKRQLLTKIYESPRAQRSDAFNTWHIPVCYEEEFGVDLPVFAENGLSKEQVVNLHTLKPLRVFMIGFLPGFLYLGGMPEALNMDRKAKPRLKVSKGAVAIGGKQTGIYPMESPGGWQIIGRTPLSLFDLSHEQPTPIRQGDKIQFYEIDLKTYQILSSH